MVSFCKFWHFVSPRANRFFLPSIKLLSRAPALYSGELQDKEMWFWLCFRRSA
jgi:hypothetical protein